MAEDFEKFLRELFGGGEVDESEEYLRRYAGWLQKKVELGIFNRPQAQAKLRLARGEAKAISLVGGSFEKLPDYRLVMNPYPGEQQAWINYWEAKKAEPEEGVDGAKQVEIMRMQLAQYTQRQERARQATMAEQAKARERLGREQQAYLRSPEYKAAQFEAYMAKMPSPRYLAGTEGAGIGKLYEVTGMPAQRQAWWTELYKQQEIVEQRKKAVERATTGALGAIKIGGVTPSAEAQQRAVALMEAPETYAGKYGEASAAWREMAEDIYAQRAGEIRKAKKRVSKAREIKPRDPWELYLEQHPTLPKVTPAMYGVPVPTTPTRTDWGRYRPRTAWNI